MSKGNGHDPLTVQMVEILGKLHVELVGIRTVVGELRADVQATNARLNAFQEQMTEDMAAVRADLSSVKNELSGLRVELRADLDEVRSSHETRLARLEAAVFHKAS